MDERTSVYIGSLWERMKLLGSHVAAERTNRTQEQEFREKTQGRVGQQTDVRLEADGCIERAYFASLFTLPRREPRSASM
jgi:hypothetical protein